MNKRGLTSEDPRPSATALRRQQFQERLRVERAEQASLQRPLKKDKEQAEPRQPARWAQLRVEARSANEAAAAMLSQAAEARAVQTKAEQNAVRQAKAAERISVEQALHQAALQQRESEREHELHTAILQKKEQRQQAAAAKFEEEVLIVQRKAEQRQKKTALPAEMEAVPREPLTPVQTAAQSEPEPAVAAERRAARNEVVRKRDEDEQRAAVAKQQRLEQQQQRALARNNAEIAAATRQDQLKKQLKDQLRDQRKEQKRQVVAQARLQSEMPVKRLPPVETAEPVVSQPEPSLREEEQQKPPAGLSLAPRAISGGSTARAIPAAPVAASSAAPDTTPFVQTRGNFIIDENGDAVILRGITLRGLDTVQAGQTVPAALSLDQRSLAAITDQWGANLVRIPFAASTILTGNGAVSVSDLLAGLDDAVALITDAGAYVLLALEAAPGILPTDTSTLQAWQTLAARYHTEPRVFYEVFFSSGPIAGDLAAQFATVIATIRQQDSASLIFVPGSPSGLDVTSVPLRDSAGNLVPNLVYTIAVSVQSVPNPDVLSAVSASYPVFASAWSDDGSDLGRQSSRVADLFERCGIGWAAANWNTDLRLVTDATSGDFSPTIWGNVVLRAIKLTTPPLLEPADAPASLATVRAENPRPSRLSTLGNFILDESGKAIALRGVTVVGLDTVAPASGQTLADALSIDENNLALMTAVWGLNLVRLPFQSQTVLTGNGTLPAGRILAGLDLLVTLISSAGAYALLAHEAAPGASLPDASTQQAWQMLAKRYKDEPGVLYEIFASTEQLAAGWLQTALSLIGTIRSQNSTAMIFVNTGNSADFTGLPLLLPTGDPIFNVVYTVNVSPQNSPGPDDGPLASFADSYPVFASTWSDDATNPSRVSPYVGDFFARHNICFAAANWNADPRLIADAVNHDFTSTPWGLIAGRAATLPIRQVLKPF